MAGACRRAAGIANATSGRAAKTIPLQNRSTPVMKLSKKIKIGLDETRMLILGAEILLGFQFRSVFHDATSPCRRIHAISTAWRSV
jgi:hypothetical protein